jgi:hypothetical protein
MDRDWIHWMVTAQSQIHGRESIMTTTVLTRLREIRESHARRRALWRELSAYTTAGDLNDIEAAIARSDDVDTDPQTQEIRRFLAARRNVSHAA